MSTYERLQFDVKVKILMVGDSGVGKSCILLRFADDKFQTTFITTIGVDLKIKTLEIDGKRIKLQIWDTAGQERFQSITSSYYKGADGVMLVLDITKQQSFDNTKKWLANIEMHTSPDIEKILVGNKCDLESKRVIPYERGEQLAEEQKIRYIETSAKTNHNIDEAFHMLVKQILKKVNDKGVTGDRDKVLDLHESENTNKCSC